MYKFLCANITKSRNFTNSYKKLAQTKKNHQDSSSRPQPATADVALGENGEENQENNEEEIGGKKGTRTPPSSTTRMQKFSFATKLPSLRNVQPAASLKMKNYPRFYTGNCIIVDPPTPSISKKYYHVYSINPPGVIKRYYGFHYKKFLSDEARENYKRAMENVHQIERNRPDFQFKPMYMSNKANEMAGEVRSKKPNKKKPSKTEITYPTHTVKHNLVFTKRYKIREGSAERKILDLEEKLGKKKRPEIKLFRSHIKKITYPKLVQNLKKGKFNVVSMEDQNRDSTNNLEDMTAQVEIIKHRPEVESQETDKKPEDDELVNIDKDFEALIRSHPTIENASKEVKMKLKTKFIQLLFKTAKRSIKYTENEIAAENRSTDEAKLDVADDKVEKQGVEAAAGRREERKESNAKTAVENITKSIISEDKIIKSHPQMLAEKVREKDYMLARHPKRVWVDDTNKYDLNKVCMKENSGSSGLGLVSSNYGKESPKPNYQKIKEEAQELSHFVKKFKKTNHQNIKTSPPPRTNIRLAENASTKLDELRQERLNFIKELENLSVKFDNNGDLNQYGDMDALRLKESSEKIRQIISGNLLGKEQLWVSPERKESTNIKFETPKVPAKDLDAPTLSSTSKPNESVDNKIPEEPLNQNQPTALQSSKVDVLNETSRKREKHFHKIKVKEEDQRLRFDLLRKKSFKRPVVKPKDDKLKLKDRMDEKVAIGEKAKKKIENIVPQVHQAEQELKPQKKRNPEPTKESKVEEAALEDHSVYDELNQTAVQLVKSKKIPEPEKGYALDQTSLKTSLKNSQISFGKRKRKEIDFKLEQDKKRQMDLDKFYLKKRKEWGQVRFTNLKEEMETKPSARVLEVNPKTNEPCGEPPNENKEDTINENQEDVDKKEKTETKGKSEGEENKQLNREVKEEHHGFALYPATHKEGSGNKGGGGKQQLMSIQEQNSSANSNKSPPDLESPNLERQTEHLRRAVDALESRKIVSPAIQENTPKVKGITRPYNQEVSNELILNEYFDPKTLPGSQKKVYVPKERLVVNNIQDVEKEKDSDGAPEVAVLRPGDEIVIYENNFAVPPGHKPESKHALEGSKAPETDKDLNKALIDKAVSLRKEMASSENKKTAETTNKINEIIQKIKDLENMLYKGSLTEDATKTDNKPRIAPPQPPMEKEKEKKNIKKDKPKSPHDMVLPPKIRGSETDEKVPKQPKPNEKRLMAKKKQNAKREGAQSLKTVSSPDIEASQSAQNNTIVKRGKSGLVASDLHKSSAELDKASTTSQSAQNNPIVKRRKSGRVASDLHKSSAELDEVSTKSQSAQNDPIVKRGKSGRVASDLHKSSAELDEVSTISQSAQNDPIVKRGKSGLVASDLHKSSAELDKASTTGQSAQNNPIVKRGKSGLVASDLHKSSAELDKASTTGQSAQNNPIVKRRKSGLVASDLHKSSAELDKASTISQSAQNDPIVTRGMSGLVVSNPHKSSAELDNASTMSQIISTETITGIEEDQSSIQLKEKIRKYFEIKFGKIKFSKISTSPNENVVDKAPLTEKPSETTDDKPTLNTKSSKKIMKVSRPKTVAHEKRPKENKKATQRPKQKKSASELNIGKKSAANKPMSCLPVPVQATTTARAKTSYDKSRPVSYHPSMFIDMKEAKTKFSSQSMQPQLNCGASGNMTVLKKVTSTKDTSHLLWRPPKRSASDVSGSNVKIPKKPKVVQVPKKSAVKEPKNPVESKQQEPPSVKQSEILSESYVAATKPDSSLAEDKMPQNPVDSKQQEPPSVKQSEIPSQSYVAATKPDSSLAEDKMPQNPVESKQQEPPSVKQSEIPSQSYVAATKPHSSLTEDNMPQNPVDSKQQEPPSVKQSEIPSQSYVAATKPDSSLAEDKMPQNPVESKQQEPPSVKQSEILSQSYVAATKPDSSLAEDKMPQNPVESKQQEPPSVKQSEISSQSYVVATTPHSSLAEDKMPQNPVDSKQQEPLSVKQSEIPSQSYVAATKPHSSLAEDKMLQNSETSRPEESISKPSVVEQLTVIVKLKEEESNLVLNNTKPADSILNPTNNTDKGERGDSNLAATNPKPEESIPNTDESIPKPHEALIEPKIRQEKLLLDVSDFAKEPPTANDTSTVPLPTVVWADKNSQNQLLATSKIPRKERPVIELAKTLPGFTSAPAEQMTAKVFPKIIWASNKYNKPFQQKSVIELFKTLPRISPTTNKHIEQTSVLSNNFLDTSHRAPFEKKKPTPEKISKASPTTSLADGDLILKPFSNLKELEPAKSKSRPNQSVTLADKNLKQDTPRAVLNIVLPKPNSAAKSTTEGKTPGSKRKLPGYSSDAKVLGTIRNSTLANKTDLDGSGSKVSKAGISTTPILSKISDKDFGGPRDRGGFKRGEEQKPKKLADNDKKAIFKILYDGEIFIIKKADDDSEGGKPKENIFNDFTKPSKEFLDSVNRILKAKSELTKDFLKEELSVNKTVTRHSSTELNAPRYNEQAKLIAKVEQFLTKSSTNVNKKEGTKQYKSSKKLKIYDKPEIDFLNYFFPSKLVLQETFLKAKIETIYDKDAPSKIREIRKSQKISIDDKPKRWKSLFCDLGTDRYQRIKDDFFECGLKKELTAPKFSIKSETILKKRIQKSTREAKVKEKQVLKSTPSEKSTREQSKTDHPLKTPASEEQYTNMHLNRKYAAMLKLIERRLALKRIVSEHSKTDQVRNLNSLEDNKTTNPEGVKKDLLSIIEPVAPTQHVEPTKTESNRDIWERIVNLRPDNMKSIEMKEEPFEWDTMKLSKPAEEDTSNMYTLKVPQNKASVEKPTYTLKIPKHKKQFPEEYVFPKQKNVLDNLFLKPKSMSPQEQIILKEESKVTAVRSKSGVKTILPEAREPKTENPAKLVETKASEHNIDNIVIKTKPLGAQERTKLKLVDESKNEATRYKTIQPNDAKKTVPIVKRTEQPRENMQVSKRRSVEKMVSKEDLVSEIEAWVQITDKNVKRQVKSEQEKVRANDQISIKLRKILGNALKMDAPKKPLKTSKSDHVNTSISKIPVPNVVSKAANEKLGQDIDANQRKGEGEARTILKLDDKFMSVEKSTRKMAQRATTASDQIRERRRQAVQFRTQEARKRKREEILQAENKMRVMKTVKLQEKKFKKDRVNEMNDEAKNLFGEQERQRQRHLAEGSPIHQKDGKVIQPSVGGAPWGSKIKLLSGKTGDDKKEIHNSTNISNLVNNGILMSKSEFLRLKKIQSEMMEKARTSLEQMERIDKVKETSQESLKPTENMSLLNKLQSEMMEMTRKKSRTSLEQDPQVQNLGEEIEKHVENANKPASKALESATQQSNSNLQERIEQELKTTINQAKHTEVSSELLNFKISKLAQLVIDDMQKNETTMQLLQKSIIQTKETPKTQPSPILKDANSNKSSIVFPKFREVKSTSKQSKAAENQSSTHTTVDISLNEARKPEVEKMMELKRNNKMSRQQLTSSITDSKPSLSGKEEHKPENQSSIDTTEDTSLNEARKPEVEKMMMIKRNKKLVRRRLKTAALKNLLSDPLKKETASAKTAENKATTSSITDNKPSSSGKVEHNPENQSSIHKTENASLTEARKPEVEKMMELKRKNKMSRQQLTSSITDIKPSTSGKVEHKPVLKMTNTCVVCKKRGKSANSLPKSSRKSSCAKIVLPMKNPRAALGEKLEQLESTLHKTVGDDIKTVPKEILEMSEKAEKLLLSSNDVKISDPLAKYRHLNITYMTVNRRAKKEDEAFLPVAAKTKENQIGEEEMNRIINYRFNLLKKLNEDFKKPTVPQTPPPHLPETSGTTYKAPVDFDNLKLKDVKTLLEKFSKISNNEDNNMNLEKILLEVRRMRKVRFDDKKSKTTTKPTFGLSKNDDNDDKSGLGGGSRRYSTDSDKCSESDKKDNECQATASEKRDFEITEAVPHAFEVASQKLERERQKDLYYRYHRMTFFDIHQYLDQKRAFRQDQAHNDPNKDGSKRPNDEKKSG